MYIIKKLPKALKKLFKENNHLVSGLKKSCSLDLILHFQKLCYFFARKVDKKDRTLVKIHKRNVFSFFISFDSRFMQKTKKIAKKLKFT
jgi:hypothetical protein